MALPSSGGIDLEMIYQEATANGYTGAKDLAALSAWGNWTSDPSGSIPHEMTEFYGADALSNNRVSSITASIGSTVSTNITVNSQNQYTINHGDGYAVGVAQRGQNTRRAFVIHENGSGSLSYAYLDLNDGDVDQSGGFSHAVAAANEGHFLVVSTYEDTTASANDTIGVWCVERSHITLTKKSFIEFQDGTSMLAVDTCYIGENGSNYYYLVCYSRDVGDIDTSFDLKVRAVIVNKSTLALSWGALHTIEANSSQSEYAKVSIVSTKNNGVIGRFSIFIYAGATDNYYSFCTYDMSSDTYDIPSSALSDFPESSSRVTSRFATSPWENLLVRGLSHPDKIQTEMDDLDNSILAFMPYGSISTQSTAAKSICRYIDTGYRIQPRVDIETSDDTQFSGDTSMCIRCNHNLVGENDWCVAFAWESLSTGDLVVKIFVMKPNGPTAYSFNPDDLKSTLVTGDSGNESLQSITAIRKNKFVLIWRDGDQSGHMDLALVTVTPSY